MKILTQDEFNAKLPRLSAIYRRYKDDGNRIPISYRMQYKFRVYEQYRKIPVEVIDIDRDIDCQEMEKAIDEQQILVISNLYNNPHPAIFGHDMAEAREFNIMARAVHDWVHYENDYLPCTAYQEYLCWIKQSEGMPDTIKQILFSEIVLQAAFCEYNNGTFAPLITKDANGNSIECQKVVLIDYERALTEEYVSGHMNKQPYSY